MPCPWTAPFLVLATQNPIEQEGTYPLPEAQLDRFLLKVSIDYPSLAEEVAVVRQVTAGSIGDALDTSRVEAVLTPADLIRIQQVAAGLTLDEAISTTPCASCAPPAIGTAWRSGAGPRASVALVRAARGHALASGNAFVTPDDVKAMAPAVLRHRIKLGADMEIEGYRPDEVLADLLADLPAPGHEPPPPAAPGPGGLVAPGPGRGLLAPPDPCLAASGAGPGRHRPGGPDSAQATAHPRGRAARRPYPAAGCLEPGATDPDQPDR